jgi:hypothetical protein
MDLEAILKELRDEHAHLSEAILAFERMDAGSGKRRGRPPLWLVTVKATGPKKRGRPKGNGKKPEAAKRTE